MPTFDFQSPEGRKYTLTGPEGSTPEQAFAVLQQHLKGAGSQRDSGDWWKNDPVQHLTGAHSERDSTGDRMPSPPPGFVLENRRQSMPSPPPGFELERPPAGSDWWSNDPIASAGQASGWDQFPLVKPAAAAKHEWWEAAPLVQSPKAAGNWWDEAPLVHPPEAAQKEEPEFGSEEYINAKAKKFNMHPDYVRGIVNSQTSSEAVKGFPILGGLANRVAAGGAALVHPVTGAGSEGSLGERYNRNLDFEKEIEADYEKSHPGTALAANLIGGTALTGGVGMTSLGAKALGLTGSLSGQIGGLAVGGLDALTRGEDVGPNAAIGAAIGGIAPGFGRIVGSAAAPVVEAVRGIRDAEGSAARRVANAISKARQTGQAMTPQEIAEAKAAGQPVLPIDEAGEYGRALARSAANTSPEARATLNEAIDPRFEQQADRYVDYLNSTYHYPDAPAQRRALDQVEQNVNKTRYAAAQKAADNRFPQGIWSPELERLASSLDVVDAMRRAAERGSARSVAEGGGGFNRGVTFDNGIVNFRRSPTGVLTYPDLRFWDYTMRNLRDDTSAAFRAGRNSEGGALSAQRSQLADELDKMVPEFQHARTGAAAFFGAENAMDAGVKYATAGGRNFSNDGARQALAKMSDTERKLFQDGFVSAYIQENPLHAVSQQRVCKDYEFTERGGADGDRTGSAACQGASSVYAYREPDGPCAQGDAGQFDNGQTVDRGHARRGRQRYPVRQRQSVCRPGVVLHARGYVRRGASCWRDSGRSNSTEMSSTK